MEISDKAEKLCRSQFEKIREIEEFNQQKVLKAFIDSGVSESHFGITTGYGYGDRGRDKLDEVFARIFGAEDALVRANFVSGTHALTTALFGILRPNDKILSITGKLYDTMMGVVDSKDADFGSLKDFNIGFDYVDYSENEKNYYKSVSDKLKEGFKLVYIQRSRGYTLRKSLSVTEIKEIIDFVKSVSPNSIVMVDNCYGEFVEKLEPSEVGADIVVGSLIKNPGGGIAPTGGYILGRKKYVEMCSYRLTAPGIGKEVGATLGINRELFMGIFSAPHAVAEALKTAVYTSALFEILGFETYPKYQESRCDIVESLIMGSRDALKAFCQGIQSGSPVDSFVCPEPWDMPGYDSQVIMAAGTFIGGSSIELSADGPMKKPYPVWVQGGTNFYAAKIGILKAAEKVLSLGDK
ncbi:MAG: methionine gamma-lyase family protein [Clostridia bacterium]|nr:methionine gamma-lyase family protein [Clostridia bacterium]